MKALLILPALVMAFNAPLLSQTAFPRTVTLSLGVSLTNQIAEYHIESYETVRVISAKYSQSSCYSFTILKDSTQHSFTPEEMNGHQVTYNFIPPKQIVFAGPATLRLQTLCGGASPCYVTMEITPQSFPPDRTVIVPPGTNQVAISLECSTNLVQWTPATNGVYGSPTEAKFFRIKANKVN